MLFVLLSSGCKLLLPVQFSEMGGGEDNPRVGVWEKLECTMVWGIWNLAGLQWAHSQISHTHEQMRHTLTKIMPLCVNPFVLGGSIPLRLIRDNKREPPICHRANSFNLLSLNPLYSSQAPFPFFLAPVVCKCVCVLVYMRALHVCMREAAGSGISVYLGDSSLYFFKVLYAYIFLL